MHSKQSLPANGPLREALRRKGQFWTPDWIAEAMVAYVVRNGSPHLFDPAVGAGAFFRAAKRLRPTLGRSLQLLGTELHPETLVEAREHGLSAGDLGGVTITDFVTDPPNRSYDSIVANPPYIRHHRLTKKLKLRLRQLGTQMVGRPLDGRAGLHVYFLLRALQLLSERGRLAFIVPADTCEGVFAEQLWRWVAARYRVDAVITFAPEASPFPKVDTNPIILLIRRERPTREFYWCRCTVAGTGELLAWSLSGFRRRSCEGLSITRRSVAEGLATGFTRPPLQESVLRGPTLLDFAEVRRGIATGANEFFFLTTRKAGKLRLPRNFLLPGIGRTRDVPGSEITEGVLRTLEEEGRPTLLFSPDGRELQKFPESVRSYLKFGESLGLPERPLIASRRPWYKMESRRVPPILFAYLGRRNARFIRNLAGVVPLTGFLCVYPTSEEPEFIEKLWRILSDPRTIANLRWVGKSYGSGAIKVEPRGLERLPLPQAMVTDLGLTPIRRQARLALP